MVESDAASWLVLDGYEDEPAAFGVPPYVGFHIRYVCGVLEQHNIDYTYVTIDQWRLFSEKERALHLQNLEGFVCIAGAVVPGGTYVEHQSLEKSRQNSYEICRKEYQPCLEVGLFEDGSNKVGYHFLQSFSCRPRYRCDIEWFSPNRNVEARTSNG